MTFLHFFSKKFLPITLSLLLLSISSWVLAHGEDDPLLSKVMMDKFEIRDGEDHNPLVLEGEAWLGKDLHKLWLKTEIERADGEIEEAEIQALYSRAVAPYWDVQIGVRQDVKPQPQRSWGVIGVQGVAPYFIDMGAALFVGEGGQTALRLEAEYELLVTQRLTLTPEIEVNAFAQDDPDLGIGSGVSNVEVGLRLSYDIRREFAPYIGLNWHRVVGGTADVARADGDKVHDVQWVVGVRAWF